MQYCLLPVTIGIIFCTLSMQAQSPVDGFFNPKGNRAIALSETYETYDTYFQGTGMLVPYIDDYLKNTMSIYAAYALSNDLALSLSLPYIFLHTTGYTDGGLIEIKRNSLQDAALFLKYRAANIEKDKYRITIAPAAGFSFPVQKYEVDVFGVGQGVAGFYPKLITQIHYNNGIFISVQPGGIIRFSSAPSGFLLDAKAGYGGNKFYTDVWYAFQNVSGGTDLEISSTNQFKNLGVSYHKAGLTCVYNIYGMMSLYIAGTKIMDGKNIGNAWSAGGGVILKFH